MLSMFFRSSSSQSILIPEKLPKVFCLWFQFSFKADCVMKFPHFHRILFLRNWKLFHAIMFCFQNCLKTCCVLWLSLVINIVSYISSEAAILLVVVFDSFITQCRWKSTTRNTTCHPFWSSVRSSNWKHSLQRTLLFLFLRLHNVVWWPCLYHRSKQCYFQGGGFSNIRVGYCCQENTHIL